VQSLGLVAADCRVGLESVLLQVVQTRVPGRTFRLLYIEDDPTDVLLAKTGLDDCAFKVDPNTLDDGEKGHSGS
jgi:hypothetical protein